MKNTKPEYIPALSFRFLTPFFDFIQKYIVHDVHYKTLLIRQANIQAGHKILDLGCGTGTLAIMVKEVQPDIDVFGLDADPEILKIAQRKADEKNASISLQTGYTNSTPYPDETFDRILSSIMIHHLKTADKIKTAKEIFRILKPDGELHIIDFGMPTTLYGKILAPFLHKFEEANDNIEGNLPKIFSEPGLEVKVVGQFRTFFGDLDFLKGKKL